MAEEAAETEMQSTEAETPATEAAKPEPEAQSTEADKPDTEAQSTEADKPDTDAAKPDTEAQSSEADKPHAETSATEATKPETEAPSADADKPDAETSAAEATEPEAETSATEATKPDAEAQSAEAQKPEEEAAPALKPASISDSKAESLKHIKSSYDKVSTISSPSILSTASQGEINLHQLVAEFLPRSLTDISDEELLGIVNDLERSVILMRIENEVFERYIKRIDASLMEDFNERLDKLIRNRNSVMRKSSSLSESSKGSLKRDANLSALESGPRINLTFKSDIVEKETTLVQQALTQFHVEMEHAHADLKAAEEEANILTQETLEASNRFERMCTYAIDPVTGRIPAEKFVRYMREWLKIAESTIEKLRLHTNTMHQNIRHMKRQLQECRDLGYTIQPIDFDQMKIENRLLKETLAMKNKHLLELKQLSGQCSLVLVQHKKKLKQQESLGQALAEKVDIQNNKTKKVLSECELTKQKICHAEPKLVRLRAFIDTYDCPSVMEYIKKIDEVSQLKQEITKWERRHGNEAQVQKIKTSIRQPETSLQAESPSSSRTATKEILMESIL